LAVLSSGVHFSSRTDKQKMKKTISEKTSQMMTDESFMRMALRIAAKGIGQVSPNPMVGCIIVKNGIVVGKGYHKKYGGPHAETHAIFDAGEAVKESTIYVTLEPCFHYGKTPPCVHRLVELKPSRVVIGTADPNPLVSGKSIRYLREQGIDTVVGILEEECRKLNECFFKFMTTAIPFVTIKYAQTLDGRIATRTGHSRWISSPSSLKIAHRLRRDHDAVLVGSGTVLRDDPLLTVRLVRGKNPLRVVIDSTLQISPDAKILEEQEKAATLVVTTRRHNRAKMRNLTEAGVEVLVIAEDENHRVDLACLLFELGKRNISSLLVEGGSQIITSFFRNRLVDRLVVITAPKVIGRGIEAIGDLEIDEMGDAIHINLRRILKNEEDIIIDAAILKCP
jgi:diaminohydroxyphosphoribosylaminopyrimidine deaminase / 5-amino-6-(5-phosphoribosylamino)uracil reductase